MYKWLLTEVYQLCAPVLYQTHCNLVAVNHRDYVSTPEIKNTAEKIVILDLLFLRGFENTNK